MAWDFHTDVEYQALLDWADEFVREEVEPLDLLWPGEQFVPLHEVRRKVIDPLKDQVRSKGLWATHLGPELGVAKQVLRDYSPSDDLWPTEWLPRKRDAARTKFAVYLDLEVGNR